MVYDVYVCWFHDQRQNCSYNWKGACAIFEAMYPGFGLSVLLICLTLPIDDTISTSLNKPYEMHIICVWNVLISCVFGASTGVTVCCVYNQGAASGQRRRGPGKIQRLAQSTVKSAGALIQALFTKRTSCIWGSPAQESLHFEEKHISIWNWCKKNI